MSQDYNPNSKDAVLSRIETKLDAALKQQDEHSSAIRKLWAALNRLDVRVAVIAVGISGGGWAVKAIFFNH